MPKQRINIIFEACQNQFNTMKHTNVDMNQERYMALYWVPKYQYHVITVND